MLTYINCCTQLYMYICMQNYGFEVLTVPIMFYIMACIIYCFFRRVSLYYNIHNSAMYGWILVRFSPCSNSLHCALSKALCFALLL